MQNVTFNETQGPGIKRRFFAAGVVIICIALSLVYVYYAPKTYEVSMSLQVHELSQTQQLLAQALQELSKENVLNRTSTSIEKGNLLRVSCREDLRPGESFNCAKNLDFIYEHMQQMSKLNIEKHLKNKADKIQNQITAIEKEITTLPGKYRITPKQQKFFNSLKMFVQGKAELESNWQDDFSASAKLKLITSSLEDNLKVAMLIRQQLTRDMTLYQSLKQWINEPKNQSVTSKVKRVVHYEDSPQLIKLKDKKAEIEASRMRLLQRATTRHPLVIKMSEQINELQAQINALTRLPKVVEDVVVRTNPELVKWRKELADIASTIKASHAKLAAVNSNITTIGVELQTALKNINQAQIASESTRLEAKIDSLKLSDNSHITPPFELYFKNTKPEIVSQVSRIDIMLYATGVGLILAFFILLSRRKTNFAVVKEEPKPDYPVLGSIPNFNTPELGKKGSA